MLEEFGNMFDKFYSRNISIWYEELFHHLKFREAKDYTLVFKRNDLMKMSSIFKSNHAFYLFDFGTSMLNAPYLNIVLKFT